VELFEPLRDEFSGQLAPDRSHLWREGMTEKEWFDVALKCGELERFYDSWGRRDAFMSGKSCGVGDWRVIKHVIFFPWERALQCNRCKLWTLVTVPSWKYKVDQPLSGK